MGVSYIRGTLLGSVVRDSYYLGIYVGVPPIFVKPPCQLEVRALSRKSQERTDPAESQVVCGKHDQALHVASSVSWLRVSP